VVVGSTVVLVVDGGISQLSPEPGAGQASQQLEQCETTPPLSMQCSSLFFVLHFVPFSLVMQQVTKPGLPQVEREAQVFTYFEHERLTRVSLAVWTAHLTYAPWVDAAEQSQAAATASRAAAMSALSASESGSHMAIASVARKPARRDAQAAIASRVKGVRTGSCEWLMIRTLHFPRSCRVLGFDAEPGK
jgi:hypothetical protein